MYAAMVNYFVNVAGIPDGAGLVSPAPTGWLVVAALLTCAVILSACVDRRTRSRQPGRTLRWPATSRMEHGLRGFRASCARVSDVASQWIGVRAPLVLSSVEVVDWVDTKRKKPPNPSMFVAACPSTSSGRG